MNILASQLDKQITNQCMRNPGATYIISYLELQLTQCRYAFFPVTCNILSVCHIFI